MLQFTLNGRLAADPDIKTYGDDDAEMARLRVASNNPGSQNTDFYDVAVFGATVEAVRDARKGDSVKVTGVGQQAIWHNDAGDRREGVSLVARKLLEHTPVTHNTRAAEQSATAGRSSTTTAVR